jgi:YgiT-type zinc finger domain-containing protein
MREVRCNVCGGGSYEECRIDYLYSHDGKYLLVPNTPVEVCRQCGAVYYPAHVLKEIERRFFAIENKTEEPDRHLDIPEKAYA